MKRVILGTAIMAVVLVAVIFAILSRNTNSRSTGPVVSSANIPYSVRMAFSFAQRKSDMERQYGKPDITRTSGNYSYEVRRMRDGSRLYVIYDNEIGIVRDIWQLKKLFDKEDFSSISPDKSTERDVKKIDPYSLVFGDIDLGTGISEHRLKDNEAVIIHYRVVDNTWVVEEIEYVKPGLSGFGSIISPEDLP